MTVQIEMDERHQRENEPSSSEFGKRLDLVHLVEDGQLLQQLSHPTVAPSGGSYR